MSNWKLNKLNSGIKNCTEVTLKLSSNAVGDSNNENNFPHKILLTNTQVSKLRKAFANNSSANMKLLKAQLHQLIKSREFLSRLLEPLLKTGLPVMKNIIKPLAKNVLISLRLTAAEATYAAIHKKTFGFDMRPLDLATQAALIFFN